MSDKDKAAGRRANAPGLDSEGASPVSRKQPSRRSPERGRRVAEARRKAGLTQRELADRIGVKRLTIIRIETGATVPTLAVGLAIARELRVPAEKLFAGGAG
jgi:putative transcriptional regulator